MSGAAVVYMHLSYEDYKAVETQCKTWKETEHHDTDELFYHKACRVRVNDGLIIEFHGPLVAGGQHREHRESSS